MAFETYEESRHSGQPIDLYLFTYGPDPEHYYAYTNAKENYTLDGIVYEAVPIQRDSPKSSGSLDKTTYKVTAARDIGLAELFRVHPPSRVVTLVIRSGHLPDIAQEFMATWSGRVLGYERQDSEIVLTCEPSSTSMKRPGLRWNYQIPCPHLLYGPECRADPVPRTVTGTVASMSNLSVTLNDGWAALSIIKYRQGVVRWTAPDGRVIVRQVLGVTAPNTLRLDAPLVDLTVGMTISIAAGCNHQTVSAGGIGDGDCVNVHNNGPNFGGCKWIPLDNPIGLGNRFY